MKELQLAPADEIVQANPDQHQKKPQFIHRMRPKKGQKVFDYDIEADTISVAKFDTPATIHFSKAKEGDLSGKHSKITMKENHFYICALNYKNAVKQLQKTFPDINPEILKT